MAGNHDRNAIPGTSLGYGPYFFLIAEMFRDLAVRSGFTIRYLLQKFPNLHLKSGCLQVERQDQASNLASLACTARQ